MKFRTRPAPHGNVLVITLLTTSIVGIGLASYLTMVSNQHLAVSRSQAWNGAIPVTESGIEEALTQLYYTGITNLSANGWTALTNGWYYKKRYLDNTSYYEVNINPVNPPVIVSTGCAPAPLAPASGCGMILGQVVPATATTPYVKRRVRVTTLAGSSMGAAVISKGPISLSGNNVTIDSFDSNDARYSTSGKWDPSKPAKDNADVLTNAGDGLSSNGKPIYALDVGDADIKGHVTSGPSGTVHLTAGGSVGDAAWVDAGTSGIESGWQSDDANVDIQDVQLPDFSGGYYTPTGTTIGKVKYTYYLDQSANYKLSTLSGKVLVTGNATLWVTDDVNIGTGEFIEIAPGASLKLYVSAPSAVIGGQGIINSDNYASSFQYFGLPTNTSFDFKGNSGFTGTVNAPEADVKLGGGGTTPYDFVGSLVVHTLTMNGHFRIHYDEALRPATPNGFLVDVWNEVDPNGPIN